MKHLVNRFAVALLGSLLLFAAACGSDDESVTQDYPQTAEISGSIGGVYVGWTGGAMIDAMSAKEATIMLKGDSPYMMHVSLKKDLAVGTFSIAEDAELVHLVLPGMNETTVTAGTLEITAWDAKKGTADLTLTCEQAKIGKEASEAATALGQMTFKVMGAATADEPAEAETETPEEG
jgi:hypothetical protein